jgi:glycosyltransferase involved in cell wall biosynthesis
VKLQPVLTFRGWYREGSQFLCLAHPNAEREVHRLKSLARHFIESDSLPVNGVPLTTSAAKLSLTTSIIICTRNRPAHLRNCLDLVARLNPAPDEVIVIDNTSGEKEVELIAREFSARYIVEPMSGLSRARNRGLFECNSEIAVFLDDDGHPDTRWLDSLIEPFSNQSVAVVTGGTFPLGASKSEANHLPTRYLSNRDHRWFEIAAFGGLGIGTNMALRKHACEGLKVFDERLGRGAPYHGMEEHHAFVRLLSLSYSAAHVPAAIVFHSSQQPDDLKEEVRNQFAYSLLLLSEYPSHSLDLFRFLLRRAMRKPLTWQRDAPDPGAIITSSWRVLLTSGLRAIPFFFRTQRSRDK